MRRATNFEEAITLFHDMLDSLEEAKTSADIYRIEKNALSALQGVHYYAAYLGRDLKLAVRKADMRLRAEQQQRINQIISPEPVETKKSKTTKTTARKKK